MPEPHDAGDLPSEPKLDRNGMRKVMELWVDSTSKIRLMVFFRQNPGVVETLEGLAQRLALQPSELDPDIKAHLELGLLREKSVGGRSVYVFNRERAEKLERMLEAALETREEELR